MRDARPRFDVQGRLVGRVARRVRPRKVKVEGNFGIEICSVRRDGIEESWFYRGVWSGVYGRIYLGKTNRKGRW